MSDQVLKLKEIEDFLFKITCEMLGLDLSKKETQSKVRISWPTNGAPSWKINEDVVFLRITPEDDKLAREQNIIYTENEQDRSFLKKQIGYTRVHKINWTLYGPSSYDNADLIRFRIFEDEYKKKFNKKNLFLITDVPMPVRLPEFYNGQWWERTDFSATFNESVVRENVEPYIKSADIRVIENR